MKKYLLEEVREIFKRNNLILLSSEYKNVDGHLECEDIEGYKYIYSLRTVMAKNFKTKKLSYRFSSKNSFAYYNMQHYMELNVTNGTKLLSTEKDYHNSEDKLLFWCGECEQTFRKKFLAFKGIDLKICPRCFKKYIQSNPNHKRNDMNTYIEKAKELGMEVLNKESVTYHEKIEVEDEYGYRGYVTLSRLMASGSKFERYSTHNPYTIYNMRRYAQLNNLTCEIPEQEFKGDKAMMTFVCECGKEFKTSLNHFVVDKKDKCNECRGKQSKISRLVQDYLEENNIVFLKEKRYKDCVGMSGLELPFDYYIPIENLCIEVDGAQHYRPVPFSGDKQKAKEMFEKTKAHDKIKTDYCLNNNIKLVRLPFWLIENSTEYKTILDNIFFPSRSSELDK